MLALLTSRFGLAGVVALAATIAIAGLAWRLDVVDRRAAALVSERDQAVTAAQDNARAVDAMKRHVARTLAQVGEERRRSAALARRYADLEREIHRHAEADAPADAVFRDLARRLRGAGGAAAAAPRRAP